MARVRITITEVDNGYIVAVDEDYFDQSKNQKTYVAPNNDAVAHIVASSLTNRPTNAPGVH